MKSDAKTVGAYLKSLPADRKKQIEKVRGVILKNLPKGFEEAMNWGMITYQVPLAKYPNTYNKQPLMYSALSSQKNYMSLYLIGIYQDRKQLSEFTHAYKKTGKRMDIGKSCIRFKTIDDLPLDLVAKAISKTDVDSFIDGFVRTYKKASSKRKKRVSKT